MIKKFVPDIERIESQIHYLSLLTDKSKPPYTRRPFTEAYEHSREWLRQKMIESNLEVYTDAASNLVGMRKGRNPELPPIMIGSHTDTVVGGGRFDGIIGVLAGIEVARQLAKNNIQLQHTLFVVDFTAEEANEFGVSTIGSRGMVGNLTEEMLNRKSIDGLFLRDGLKKLGGRPDLLQKEKKELGDIHLYLELHIEQGPVLDRSGNELGVVTGIVGIRRLKVVIEGEANHAGTTPMHMRKDALTAASEAVLAIEKVANYSYKAPFVGTVGRLDVQPNGSNIVPGKVTFDFELRSLHEEDLECAIESIKSELNQITLNRNISIEVEHLSLSKAINIKDGIIKGIEESCNLVGKSLKLPSGAGHDANQLAKIAPVGMIFVPSKQGISHAADEWTDYALVVNGIHALWNAVHYFDAYEVR